MIGALLGDMIGAPYKFDRGNKTKEFPLFSRTSRFTDDSVMTIAVAEALMNADGKSDEEIKAALVRSMQKWGRRYPNAGYGGRFESTGFEDAIRNAVSLGGDTDTIACITGSIAEAFYGIPAEIAAEGKRRLPDDMLEMLDKFELFAVAQHAQLRHIGHIFPEK